MVDALRSRAHSGNRSFTARCVALLKHKYGFKGVFLTPSCTSAMEMGAILADLGQGSEVILPSYTFSSTANAIVLQGASPIFCEVDPNTMNIDPNRIEELISDQTKMIIPIDYAGIPCDLDRIMAIAQRHDLVVMEDAAQSIHSFYKEKACGSIPDLAAFSFHETKNVTCGEGGRSVKKGRRTMRAARSSVSGRSSGL